MDLGAYANIGNENIDKIVEENNIQVPRLRGYRLMKFEKPIVFTKEEILQYEIGVAIDLISRTPTFGTGYYGYEYSGWKDLLEKYYLIKNKNYDPTVYTSYKYLGIRWDRIHGCKRKILKWEIKKKLKRVKQQYDMFNKYCGREDILYVHARIGGGNWAYYYKEVQYQPWFIEKVDDSFDRTYCDIYARIKTSDKQ